MIRVGGRDDQVVNDRFLIMHCRWGLAECGLGADSGYPSTILAMSCAVGGGSNVGVFRSPILE